MPSPHLPSLVGLEEVVEVFVVVVVVLAVVVEVALQSPNSD